MCCSLQELREDVVPWMSLEAAALRAAGPSSSTHTCQASLTATRSRNRRFCSTDEQAEPQAGRGLCPKTQGVGLRSAFPSETSLPLPQADLLQTDSRSWPRAVSIQGAGSLLFVAFPALLVTIPSDWPPSQVIGHHTSLSSFLFKDDS